METFKVKKFTTFTFTLVFFIASFDLISQIDTVLQLPCPVGGISTTQLTGQLTTTSSIRKKPILLNGCNTSNKEYPFQSYWVRIPKDITLNIKNNSKTDVAIYNAYTDVLNTACSSLLWTIKENQILNINPETADRLVTVVIHAAIINDYPKFSLEFSHEVGIYDADCTVKFYKNCDRDTLSQPKNKTIFNEDFISLVQEEGSLTPPINNNYGNLVKSYKLHGEIIAQSEHLVLYGKLDDFPGFYKIEDLQDFELSCEFPGYPNDFNPESIYQYLKETVGDSVARMYQWPGFYKSGKICDQYYYSYQDQVLKNIDNISVKIIRAFTFLNWSSGETFKKSQNITILNDQPVKIERFETINTHVDNWSCVATLTLPIPKLTSNCMPNLNYLKLYVPPGISSERDEKQFKIAGIPKGKHRFYFVYDDGVNKPDTSVLNVNVYKYINQQFPLLKLPIFYIDSTLLQLNVSTFSNYITDFCTDYWLDVEEPITPCDSINDGIINLCCDMIAQPNENYYVKVTFKEYGIDSTDQIMLVDSFWISAKLDVRQQISKMECPENVLLDCQTLDYSPSITGYAKGKGVCSESDIFKFSDTTIPINATEKTVYRTFRFPDFGTSQQTCTQIIKLECTSSTNDSEKKVNLLALPNPFDDFLIIHSNGLEKEADIQFFDIKGRSMDTKIIYDNVNDQFQIDTHHWPKNAIYIYRIVTNGSILSGKVVKL